MNATRTRRLVLGGIAAVAAVGLGAAVGLTIINSGILAPGTAEGPAVTGSPSPTPAASQPAGSTSPIGPNPTPGSGDLALQMPTGDDCLACHTTASGGVGTVPVPPIGHPLEGWTACTSCHSNDRLVQTAPGHTGIHADQCLICHKATTPAAENRPHSTHRNVACLSCHGSSAPLPASMQNRSEGTCFLCHQGASTEAPLYLHPTPTDGKCLACHVAGKVGALPADHADRTNSMCTSCHAQADTEVAKAPHDLTLREGMCEFCHGASPSPSSSPSQ